jgi:SsrA-binding protein
MSKGKENKSSTEFRNRKASYEYFFIETWVAGIELKGTEVKSIREGKVQFTDAWCSFSGNDLFIRDLHINEYEFGNLYNHDPKRPRRLLLKKQELIKIKKKVQEKGLTLIPVKLFIISRGLVKIEIALARGKQTHDKRDSIKEKDIMRDMARAE